MASALTTFAPLTGDVDAVEAYTDALAPEVFARLEMVHLARVQIFRSLVHQGPRQRRTDTLRTPQLVFTSTFDGPLDAFLDALAERVPEADGWWGACAGYPGREDRAAFRAFVNAHSVRTSLFASALPDATVAEVREALELRERLVAFAVEAQGLDAAARYERFRVTFG
jgi:hypothetical protein